MKCQYCNTANPEDGTICRMCGKSLEPQTVIERFPQYQFLPIRTVRLKNNFSHVMYSLFGGTCFLYIIEYFFWVFLYENGYGMHEDFISIYNILVVVVLFISFRALFLKGFIPPFFMGVFPNFYPLKQLQKVVEYMQDYEKYSEKYVFIVNKGKFGIYDVMRYKIQLPTEFDFLSWNVKNCTLNVLQNGRKFTIDIYGNELK